LPQTRDLLLTRATPVGIEIITGDHRQADLSGDDYFGAMLQYPGADGEVFDYADFIAQAKQDYLAAARRREVKPIESTVGGTVMKVKIRPGDELRAKQVVAEVATAKVIAPAEAIEGSGTTCVVKLASGAKLEGTLLTAGSTEATTERTTERMIELDRVPKDVVAGNLGDVVIHCE